MTISKKFAFRILVSISFLIAGSSLMQSCNQEAKGFALPEGNAMIGKTSFVMLKCYECHSVANINWGGNDQDLHVPLGGEVRMMKSYGELVTSIINPSHKIAKRYFEDNTATEDGSSKMKNYNEVMTVQELVDIVTFLQEEYKIERPVYNYPMY